MDPAIGYEDSSTLVKFWCGVSSELIKIGWGEGSVMTRRDVGE
ncbi:hypothetical protein [Rubritalea tangerina]